MAERSALVSELALATPPNLPRATAFWFFFALMPYIISLSGKLVKGKLLCSALFPPYRQFGTAPFEPHITAQPYTGQRISGSVSGLLPNPTRWNTPTLSQFDCINDLENRLIWQHCGNAPSSVFAINYLQVSSGYGNRCFDCTFLPGRASRNLCQPCLRGSCADGRSAHYPNRSQINVT